MGGDDANAEDNNVSRACMLCVRHAGNNRNAFQAHNDLGRFNELLLHFAKGNSEIDLVSYKPTIP